MKIIKIVIFSTDTQNNESYVVGQEYWNGRSTSIVTNITEHIPDNVGLLWYYDIFFTDGVIVRSFSPNKVTFVPNNDK